MPQALEIPNAKAAVGKRMGNFGENSGMTADESQKREHTWKPGSGTHSVFTHFPKDPNCEICFKTKITRAYCGRHANGVVPGAEHFGT